MKRALLLAVAAGLVTVGATSVPSSASSLRVDHPVVEQRACSTPAAAMPDAMTCPIATAAP